MIEIRVNSLPMVYAGLDLDLCIGDSFTLNALGNGAMSWNNVFPNGQSLVADSSMTFVVKLTDSNACVNYDTLLLNVPQLVDVYTGIDTAVCQFDSITLSGSGADQVLTFTYGLTLTIYWQMVCHLSLRLLVIMWLKDILLMAASIQIQCTLLYIIYLM